MSASSAQAGLQLLFHTVAGVMAAQSPSICAGPEGLRLNLAALQPEPAGQHIAAAAAGDSGPSFRSFSGSRIFADLLEGPSPGIAA